MSKSIKTIIFIFIVLTQNSWAQDTIQVKYSQETDTLFKQRFLDRYEYVFMTKVPTRHMFKVGLSQYFQPLQFTLLDDRILNNSSLTLGYEFKFLPAFSIALSSHIPFYTAALDQKYVLQSIVGDAQLRWYFDMKKRIRSGKSANNFSGNYIAFNYTTLGVNDMGENKPTFGLKFGFQRRFLNAGFFDFAVSIQQRDPTFYYGLYDMSFSTQASFGFAFGDWKKAKRAPLCDLLICDESFRDQWKIKLPEVTFVFRANKIRLGIGYERKIKESPYSINIQYDAFVNKGFSSTNSFMAIADLFGKYSIDVTREISQILTIQPRYYLFQKRDELLGKSSNGFSGFYAGINSEYNFYLGKHNVFNSRINDQVIKKHILKAGPLFGFQQRLFSHGYFDLNTSVNYQNQSLRPVSNSHFNVKLNLGVGLAF